MTASKMTWRKPRVGESVVLFFMLIPLLEYEYDAYNYAVRAWIIIYLMLFKLVDYIQQN